MAVAARRLDSGAFVHAVEQIRRARIHRQPFPHIIVEALFPDEFFQGLRDHFPDRSEFEKVEYPGTGHGRGVSNYHDYGYACRDLTRHAFFRDVHRLFKSEAFTRALLEKFSVQLDDGFWPIPLAKHRHFEDGANDFTSVFDLQIDLPGYEIPPHPDHPGKIVTYQYFLVDDESLREFGTALCRPTSGETTSRPRLAQQIGSLVTRAALRAGVTGTRAFRRLERSGLGIAFGIGDNRNWLPWRLVDVIKVVPALPNCFMAFPPNATSYHAIRLNIPPHFKLQERKVIRGFIRAGADSRNWIKRRM
jgi:hypothetical protein